MARAPHRGAGQSVWLGFLGGSAPRGSEPIRMPVIGSMFA
jgi:hypothetical protein